MAETGLKEQPQVGPGLKYDKDKTRMELLPPRALFEVARVLTHGAKKYGPRNWSLVDNHVDRYMGACLRHLNSFQQGELIDSESNISHLGHAICCLLFILEKDLTETHQVIPGSTHPL
jgi:hypothetical protein